MCNRFCKLGKRCGTPSPNGNKSRELLSGADALDFKGIIYALVNADMGNFFHVELPTYIGQSSESVLQRTVRTFDKSLSARKGGREPIIVQAFMHTDRWWSKWVIIPLEVIPSPTGTKSASNDDFLQKFRSMALVHEQAWICELHTGFPHGYNIEVHFPSEKTLQRYQERKHSGKSKK